MSYFKEVEKELLDFKKIGFEVSSLGTTLIGKATHIAPLAWLHSIYKPLSKEDINNLELKLNINIPNEYKKFLNVHSNGLKIFSSALSLDGYRKVLGRGIEASRQPFSILTINVDERPYNAKPNYFFIGGYQLDGSLLFIDTETNKVHYCLSDDATSLFGWDSFEVMLMSEVQRLKKIFDKKGLLIGEEKELLPPARARMTNKK